LIQNAALTETGRTLLRASPYAVYAQEFERLR
jgi:hypothetical protein